MHPAGVRRPGRPRTGRRAGARTRRWSERRRADGRTGVTLEVALGSAEATIAEARRLPPGPGHRAEPLAIRARSPTRSSSGGGPRVRQADGLLAGGLRRAVPVRRAGARLHPRPPRHERRPPLRGRGRGAPTPSRSCSRSRRPASPPTSGWWNVGVRHDATGELVGISEMYLPTKRPWIVFQGDTGVRPGAPRPRARRVDEGGQPPPARATSAPRSRSCRRGTRAATSRCCGSTAPSASRRCSASRPGTCRWGDPLPWRAHEGELGVAGLRGWPAGNGTPPTRRT